MCFMSFDQSIFAQAGCFVAQNPSPLEAGAESYLLFFKRCSSLCPCGAMDC